MPLRICGWKKATEKNRPLAGLFFLGVILFVLEDEDQILYDRVQERNLARQYDLLITCIEVGIIQGVRAFDKYLLWSLNAAAVSNISQFGGRFREEPVYLKDHTPPHFEKVRI